MQPPERATIRLDKWLWFARFFKTRGLAARTVAGGHVRVNADRVSKPATAVAPGDTLTFAQARRIRVVRIAALGVRRGPAVEAQALYEDLSPPEDAAPAGTRPERGGRPDRDARRAARALKGSALE